MVKPVYDLMAGPSCEPESIDAALEDVRALICTYSCELHDPMASAVEAYRVLRYALANFPPPVSD